MAEPRGDQYSEQWTISPCTRLTLVLETVEGYHIDIGSVDLSMVVIQELMFMISLLIPSPAREKIYPAKVVIQKRMLLIALLIPSPARSEKDPTEKGNKKI